MESQSENAKITIDVPETYEELFSDTIEELEDIHIYLEKRKYYPSHNKIYAALEKTPIDKVRVLIMGQDPFHTTSAKTKKGIAQGLSFSVDKSENIPPSTKNIYKELETDIEGFKIPKHGDLSNWTKEGVMLLNATLTVAPGEANSHKGIWIPFVSELIKFIIRNRPNIIVFLWGKDALKYKGAFGKKAHILECGHPSPFSVKFFTGNSHFSKANKILTDLGEDPINWNSLNE